MNNICLFGASGHGKVVKEIALSIDIIVDAYIDDNPKSDFLLKIPVFTFQEIEKYKKNNFIISVGNNQTRKLVSERIRCMYTKLIHASAIISPTVSIAEGTVVMAGVNINADTIVGKHTIINTAAVIEHDCKIGDFVHISPNATVTGNVNIGEGTHIGAGATIIPGISIGKWVTIGAGSVIIKDIPDNVVVVGNPGRIVKYSNK